MTYMVEYQQTVPYRIMVEADDPKEAEYKADEMFWDGLAEKLDDDMNLELLSIEPVEEELAYRPY